MDVIFQQGFETLRGGGLTVPVLLLMFAIVIGWFPGHNAHRRHHAHARRVGAASWCLIFVSIAITIAGLLDGFVAPLLLGIWVAITTWSYGRSNVLPKAIRAHAFEVMPTATPVEAIAIDGGMGPAAVGS
jgi:hypothetical protein